MPNSCHEIIKENDNILNLMWMDGLDDYLITGMLGGHVPINRLDIQSYDAFLG